MGKIHGWTREEKTVGEADPTTTVTWSKGNVRITEFQNLYTMEFPNGENINFEDDSVAADLHKCLEDLHHIELEHSDAEPVNLYGGR